MSNNVILDIDAPKFTWTEHDESQFSSNANGFKAACVFASEKGSTQPKDISSQHGLRTTYGTVDSALGYGKITVDEAVLAMPVTCLRVAPDDARYGLITFANLSNDPALSGTIGGANPYGTKNGYASPDIETYVSYCSGPIGAATGGFTFSSLTGPNPQSDSRGDSYTFNAVNAAVVEYLTAKASNHITDSYALSVTSTLSGGTAYGSLAWLGEGVPYTDVGDVIWSPNSSKSVWSFSDSWLFNVLAENPGAWINQYGVSISNIDTGSYDVYRMSIASSLTSGDTIKGSIVIAGTSYDFSVVYDESSDQTLKDLCTQITDKIEGSNAVPVSVNGETSGFLNINISSNVTGANTMTFSNWTISSGTAVTISQLITGVSGSGTFNLNVWSKSNLVTPVESFTCSLSKQLDGFGYQLFIEDVVNVGTSGSPSKYIRVVKNSAITSDAVISESISGQIFWFSGGKDGSLVEDTEIAAGWSSLVDRSKYDFWFCLNGGYTSSTVQTAISNLCNTRTDCFGILDVPTASQSADGSREALWMSTSGLSTSYTALFTPDIYKTIVDENTKIYVPPSGLVGRAFGDCANNYSVFNAAAGVKRGTLTNASGVYISYDDDARKVLAQNCINPITKSKTGGYAIRDVLTTQNYTSLLSFITVRLGFIYIHRSIESILEKYEFENITATEMYYITQELRELLKPLVDAEMLQSAGVQCDTDLNPQATAITGKLRIRVWGTGVAPIREIATDAYITADDTSFVDYAV